MYHILIVDEEEHLLWALERNLFGDRDDVLVHTASSGEEGLAKLEEESIDLLISDIKMPGDVDGFQLILRAKEKVPDARVMIITAFGTHRIKNFAERIGISHYIEKPFTVDELRNAVLEIIDEKEGFQGVLSDLELTDIIQMLCLAKRTALLHLKHRDHRGRIVFDTGDVVHAEFDDLQGEEAVYQMLDLRQGDIFMQSDFEAEERTIDIGWQDLLLEGVKRTDEQRLEAEQERARQEREARAQEQEEEKSVEEATGPGNETSEVSDADLEEADLWERDASGRTKTPIGMRAPTFSDFGGEEPTFRAPQIEEASSGMFFSEEELDEISRASEAAIDESELDDEEGSDAEAETQQSEEGLHQELEEESSAGEREEPPTVEVSREMFAAVVQQSTRDSLSQAEVTQEEEPSISSVDQGWAAAVGFSPESSEVSEVEETSNSASRPRRRSSTSPGMTAVSAAAITEESGEFEMFAAPALSGRNFDSNEGPDTSIDQVGIVDNFIKECPGLKALAVVPLDASAPTQFINLGYADSIEGAELSAGLAHLFQHAEKSARALFEDDTVEELQFILDAEYLLMRAVTGHPVIHMAVIDRQVSLGIAVVLMRQMAKKYAAT